MDLSGLFGDGASDRFDKESEEEEEEKEEDKEKKKKKKREVDLLFIAK